MRRISTFRNATPPEEGSYIPELYIKSDWKADPSDIPEVEAAIKAFTHAVTQEQRRYNRTKLPNLFPHHWNIIKFLKNHDDYIVVEADKNLGGNILSRDDYIARAFQITWGTQVSTNAFPILKHMTARDNLPTS